MMMMHRDDDACVCGRRSKKQRTLFGGGGNNAVNNAVRSLDAVCFALKDNAAAEWTPVELDSVEKKIQELQDALKKVKQQREAPKEEQHENAAIVPLLFTPEVVRQVSLSGFLTAEELSRFLLCSCKFISTHLVSKDFCHHAIRQAVSKKCDHQNVPTSIQRKLGPKLILDHLTKPAVISRYVLLQQPITLSVDKLFLSLKFYHKGKEVYSGVLTGKVLDCLKHPYTSVRLKSPQADLWNRVLAEKEENKLLLGEAEARKSEMEATLFAFRVDANQMTGNLLHYGKKGIWGVHNNLGFSGHILDQQYLHLSVEFRRGEIAIFNKRGSLQDNTNISFCQIFHHFAPWVPENHKE